jgi:hypothetical protein
MQRERDTDTQTDGRDLWSTPFGLTQVPWYTYQVSYRLTQAFRSLYGMGINRHRQQGDRINLLFFQNGRRTLNKTIATTHTFLSYVASYYSCAQRLRKRRSEFHETVQKAHFGQNRTFSCRRTRVSELILCVTKKKRKAIPVTGHGGP